MAVHERGFLVGGMGGRLFLFESASRKGTGGRRQDAYVLSRVVRLFDTDLVELGNGKGSDYRWVSCRRGNTRDQVREAFLVDPRCLPKNLLLGDLRNVNMYIYSVHEGIGLRRKVNRRETVCVTGERRLCSRSVCETATFSLRLNQLAK